MGVKKHIILLVGTGDYVNKGCEAIVRGTVEILSQRFPDARFILSPFGKSVENNERMETDPRIQHRLPRSPYIERFSSLWWKYNIFLRAFPELRERYIFGVQMECMEKADFALEIGGDNYSLDYGTPGVYVRLDNSLLSTGKPLILWGASIGPFTGHPKVEDMIKEHLSRFNLICARESETVDYLKSIGIVKNVRLVADPAFLMPPRKPLLSEELSSFIYRSPVGLNLSPLIGSYKAAYQRNKWGKEASECIRRLVNSDIAPILLVPHVMQKDSDDYEFMSRAIGDELGWNDRLKILPPNLSAAEYKWIISNLRVFIGARTHSTIASLSSGVPTISVGYSMKSRGINKDIFGHSDWVLPVNDLNPDSLLAMTEKLLSDEHTVRLELDKKIPEIKALALSAADYIEESINKF